MTVITAGFKLPTLIRQIEKREQEKNEASQTKEKVKDPDTTGNFLQKLVKTLAAIAMPWLPIVSSFLKSHEEKCCGKELEVEISNIEQNDAEMIAEQKELMDNSDLKNKIFDFHKSSKEGPKTQVILFMGNMQSFEGSKEGIGIRDLYEKLKKEDNHDVMIFRVGDAVEELNFIAEKEHNPKLIPATVLAQTKKIIQARNESKGIFQGMEKPKDVAMIGYSWGGGTLSEINADWKDISNGVDIRCTATIDAVKYGCQNLGSPLRTRPEGSDKHLNIFQNNSYIVSGDNMQGIKREDQEFTVKQLDPKSKNKATHYSIDDNQRVKQKIGNFTGLY